MRTTFAASAVTAMATVSYATLAFAAPSAEQVLAANKAATGKLDGKATLKLEYAYAGQGMTGKTSSLDDLNSGSWVDTFAIGPATGANGFDGTHAWQKDQSGAVTLQDAADARKLAINESYRRANMWWRPGFGGAAVVSDGQKTDGGNTYDVLTVTPKGGQNFDAWFDAKTHLLARLVEMQGMKTVTTFNSDYRSADGVQIPAKQHTNEGDKKYDQDFTLASATFLPKQEPAVYSMPKVVMTDATIAGGDETTFPFHLYNNHIYADVKVNDKGPYQFIFDTGGMNLLTPPLVTTLGLKSEGQMQGGGAGSGHMDVGMTKVTSLSLGKAQVKDQVFLVMPLNSMSNIEGVAMPGMVGFETFRRFVTVVDYGKGTITLIKPDKFDPKDAGAPVKFEFNGNGVDAPATYNGVPGVYTIDTGSRSSLTLNGPFAKEHGFDKGGMDAVTGWGVGGPSRAVAVRGGDLKLGGYDIKHPVVEVSTDKGGAFAGKNEAGNIGAGILKRFVVTLDYEHMTMYVKPVSVPVADLDTFDRSGMWINEDGAGYKVVDVTRGAPAEKAGLKVDDEIVAIDGKPAKSIPIYEMRKRLRNEAPGTVVKFTVKRGSETKDVSVTLKDLI